MMKGYNMDQEKYLNSKVYIFFDWLWKIFVLNVMTLLTSFGVVTILPSFTACYASINELYQKGNTVKTNLFKIYFHNFKIHFKKSLLVGVAFLVAFAIMIYAFFYYRVIITSPEIELNSFGIAMYIGYYFTFFLVIITLIVFNQMPAIITFFNFRYCDNFKFSFIISFRFLFKSLLVILAYVASAFLLMYLTAVWMMFGISFIIAIMFKLFNNNYIYLCSNKANIEIEEID